MRSSDLSLETSAMSTDDTPSPDTGDFLQHDTNIEWTHETKHGLDTDSPQQVSFDGDQAMEVENLLLHSGKLIQ